jgi:hypothetical protein
MSEALQAAMNAIDELDARALAAGREWNEWTNAEIARQGLSSPMGLTPDVIKFSPEYYRLMVRSNGMRHAHKQAVAHALKVFGRKAYNNERRERIATTRAARLEQSR